MKGLIRFSIVFIFALFVFLQINAQVKTKTFYRGIPAEMIPNRDSAINERNITAPENFSVLLEKGKSEKGYFQRVLL